MKRIKFALIVIVVIGIAGFSLNYFDVFRSEPLDTDDWQETPESVKSEYIDPNTPSSVPVITLDKQNIPHIVSYSIEDKDFIHTYKQDGEWLTETIDSSGDVGDGHDIVFDQDNVLHAAYRDKTNKAQKYATKINGIWRTFVIDQPGEPQDAEGASIAVSSDNIVYIVYGLQSTEKPSELKIAEVKNRAWQVRRLGIEGHWPSISFDDNNNLHLAYVVDSSGLVKYTKEENGAWSEEVAVDPDAKCISDPRLSLDKDNNPHIIYRAEKENIQCIRHVWLENNVWKTENLALNVGSGQMEDLASAPDGTLVAVYAHSPKGLILAALEGETWKKQTVGPARVCSIVVDKTKAAHIAHTADSPGGQGTQAENAPQEEREFIKYLQVTL